MVINLKKLRNENGSFLIWAPIIVIATAILLANIITFMGAQITAYNIQHTIRNEMVNIPIRISEDTYKAMREGTLEEYILKLQEDEYKQELLEETIQNISETMPLSSKGKYDISNFTLNFVWTGNAIEYIATCDVQTYYSVGNEKSNDNDFLFKQVKFSGKHNMISY